MGQCFFEAGTRIPGYISFTRKNFQVSYLLRFQTNGTLLFCLLGGCLLYLSPLTFSASLPLTITKMLQYHFFPSIYIIRRYVWARIIHFWFWLCNYARRKTMVSLLLSPLTLSPQLMKIYFLFLFLNLMKISLSIEVRSSFLGKHRSCFNKYFMVLVGGIIDGNVGLWNLLPLIWYINAINPYLTIIY